MNQKPALEFLDLLLGGGKSAKEVLMWDGLGSAGGRKVWAPRLPQTQYPGPLAAPLPDKQTPVSSNLHPLCLPPPPPPVSL